MSLNSVTPTDPPLTAIPHATDSLHAPYLEAAVPEWLINASAQRKQALRQAGTSLPQWYTRASPQQRKAVDAAFKESMAAQVRLDKTLSGLKDIDAFARPILTRALKKHHNVHADVDTTLLCLVRPLTLGIFNIEIDSFDVLKLPLLQAALHNFEARECVPGAYHRSSGFIRETATPGVYKPVKKNLKAHDFMRLCRTLNIGGKYQTYLNRFFYPTDPAAQTSLREHFITAQKTALRAAAERALLENDIGPQDHAMILSVVNGEVNPRVGGKQVWFHDLGLMRERLVGCVLFTICEKNQPIDASILYVPNDPEHPLKRYTGTQMSDTLKRLLSARDPSQPQSANPTPYQRFFGQFMPYEKQPYYFSQFVRPRDDAPSGLLTTPWLKLVEITNPFGPLFKINERPPERTEYEPEPEPYTAVSLLPREDKSLWDENTDLWAYLYDQHRNKVLADARSHAVPTRDVDIKVRDAKLAALLEIGMLGLNVVAAFVPGLGEVMMGIMAAQLLSETVESVVEWSDGDKHAAKAHLVDVAENLALIALMAGAGAGFKKLTAVAPEPVIEGLSPVTLPNGETRLWKPDLSGYECDVSLGDEIRPNELGQYKVGDKTYLRQGGHFYQQIVDESTGQWLIRHPSEPNAYRPVIEHNGRGAWRQSLEHPMTWDRLTLLRRMGHVTDGVPASKLLMLADISGVSESTLRKMHLDHAPPPPELLDALRLFKAEAGARQTIEQLRGAAPIDHHYQYGLPLVTGMPRWPTARALEVFEGTQPSGPSIRYGEQKRLPPHLTKPAIRLTREQVLNGEMPARILESLEESEIRQLLGDEVSPRGTARAEAFRQQLADFAYSRQSAVFDSLYKGTEAVSARARVVQRECPGLSDVAAQEVLDHASSAELARLDATGRTPLNILEEARWHSRQGRQMRAFAGLRSDHLASADSRRLALHALERLPGWPPTLRLEVREGSPNGALLDHIGQPNAPIKRYLVKNGPVFQAFDDGGQALDSVPSEGDSFYSAIMHALPDDARTALGVPEVSASHVLQRNIIDAAQIYRRDAASLLAPRAKWFKPPVRLNAKLTGYYASGRGPGLNPHLGRRVLALYPGPGQAQAFLIEQAGLSERDVLAVLAERRSEWNALNHTLEHWQAEPMGQRAEQQRVQFSREIRAAWRNAPLAAQSAQAAGATRLSLVCDTPLPRLTQSFAHVRELSVRGTGMTDANADGFLTQFPGVTDLSIGDLEHGAGQPIVNHTPLTTLPVAVTRLSGLTRLRFTSHAPSLSADFAPRLRALTTLEELHIDYSGLDSTRLHSLDLTPLTGLRRLRIDAPNALWQWPGYVEQLEQLERLDLSRTAISSIPESMYSGHERLWSGLSLDWSHISPAAFMRAYEYVSSYSGPLGHLVDVDQMVSQYCLAELDAMALEPESVAALPEALNAAWPTAQERLGAIRQLRAEHEEIFELFYPPVQADGWRTTTPRVPAVRGGNAEMLRALNNSWLGAVRQRYGLAADVATFEWPERGVNLSLGAGVEPIRALASLPAGSFPHVRTLRLGGLDVPAAQARRFIRAFSATETLEISGNGFTELPFASDELPELTRLDASRNRLGPEVQAQIDRLQHIRSLNLSNNRLHTLDVSGLPELQALSLRATSLHAWPTGAENLPRLAWLDLRDNQIAELPQHVLSDPDLLLRSHFSGNPFNAAGQTAFAAAMQRIEQAQGLRRGTLARFAAEPLPAHFPPGETGASLAERLLPLPEPGPIAVGEAGFVTRLKRLDPLVTQALAERNVREWRAAGMSIEQIDVHISEWQHNFEALTRQLNDWLYTRERGIGTRRVTAQGRQIAAQRIREAWLTGLTIPPGRSYVELQLENLPIGDLPVLVTPLPRVVTLNLRGVGMTGQGANGFLAAFANLEVLNLSDNELALIPDAVLQMDQLVALHMQRCNLASATRLHPLLSNRLQRLYLGNNQLTAFTAPDLGVLDTLDLSDNRLGEWPAAVLQAPRLHTLILSGNRIAEIPPNLFRGQYPNLVVGTDLSGNPNLSLTALQRLRHHTRMNQSNYALGVSRTEIDAMVDERIYGSGESSPEPDNVDIGAIVLPAEDVLSPVYDVSPRALEPWLADTPAHLIATRRAIWTQLAQEPGHERFFQLIRFLRLTEEFRQIPADLTHRLWDVMQAASENTELRELLFQGAETHGTCIDGRILAFSEMEVRVSVYRVLLDIPLNQPVRRGQALLRTSRQLFRLERVEALAEAQAAKPGSDPAEVRLSYRIGMTRAWDDGIELPGQPSHMSFDRPISGELQATTRASIMAAEQTDALLESMLSRDYWLTYLQENYQPEMDAIDAAVAEQGYQLLSETQDRLERGEIDNDQYERQLVQASFTIESQRIQSLIELTRRMVNDLQGLVAEHPGRDSPQPGPSWRP
ncbi:hypothetical protein HU755_25045 [Pseudomonas sp. SWRI111]|uniref:NEL-type E3 ubiquitin ligase domain-containing protein n=1 Tax=Pseudomonas sp. SWRI111 TaxID=2745507 RepID=UPI0016440057|nr:NEL-type E3 ubiquitin ligase domain-containing protein [Pseudomonas sp. SWRI111]MBC3210076.1 hypothetical protein [Pseudomonas sp. SWRI111]